MIHKTHYSLVMRNYGHTRCNARVEIDGKHQGTWRISGKDSISIERPAHDDGIFTFYKLGTAEANAVVLDGDDPNLGLIKVTFTPEKEDEITSEIKRWREEKERYGIDFDRKIMMGGESAKRSFSAGGTGLSGQSDQRFGNADQMELDHVKTSVIHLRLVAKNQDEPRPLTSFSTPVPPPIR